MSAVYTTTVCIIFIQFFIGFCFYIAKMFLDRPNLTDEQIDELDEAIKNYEQEKGIDKTYKFYKYFSVLYQVIALLIFSILLWVNKSGSAMDVFCYIYLFLAGLQAIFAIVLCFMKKGITDKVFTNGEKEKNKSSYIYNYLIFHFVGIGISPVLLFNV